MERDTEEISERMRQVKFSGTEGRFPSLYVGNAVSSASYTWASLVPKNLFEQFQRTSNIWFLLVSVFQLIPFNLNPTDSWSTILPLFILITFTLLIDAYNDYHRKKEDKKFNNLDYSRWDGELFTTVKSKDIRVGDLLLLSEKQVVPADCLLFAVGGGSDICYANVASIEGALNLKPRKPVAEAQRLLRIDENYSSLTKKLSGKLRVSSPNPDFLDFRGFLSLDGHPRHIELTEQEIMFRGSIMRGAPWVLLLVVYAGVETKTILNIKNPEKKTSKIENQVNQWVLYVLLVLLGLVIFSMVANYSLSSSDFESLSIIEAFVLFTLLYNNIIPISLFLSMDIVRVVQMFFIERWSNKHVNFKTGEVNEDLGQVEYILTDKSGTLTQGHRYVGKCIISGTCYAREDNNDEPPDELSKLKYHQTERVSSFFQLKERVQDDVASYQFVRCMSLCNSIIPQIATDPIEYLGTSTDEIALVECARELGVELVQKSESSSLLETRNGKEIYSIIASCPFSSESRRSRVLVKSEETEIATLYVKGALDVMKPLMKFSQELSLDQDTESLSRIGMRTMVLGYKELSARELEDFAGSVETARFSVINKGAKIESIFQEFESGLDYLGTTGIEEEILPETRETIEALRRASIKLWVVSGDTQDSVIAASLSAGIIDTDLPICALSGLNSTVACNKALQSSIDSYIFQSFNSEAADQGIVPRRTDLDFMIEPMRHEDRRGTQEFMGSNRAEALRANHPMLRQLTMPEQKVSRQLAKPFNPFNVNFALSLDGSTFKTAVKDSNCRQMLVCLIVAAENVLCHHFLPKDKATLLKLLRENVTFRPVTLAIGNGNNDIAMIQEASVGVGIRSREGAQARFFSEIEVNAFSDLRLLLLVHGHWNYSRMARVVLLFLYKNFILTVATFFFTFLSDFSGTSIFDAGLLVGYNIFFTTMPVIVLGVFDEDLSAGQILRSPQIYVEGLANRLFSLRRLLVYSSLSMVHGLLLSLLVAFGLREIVDDFGHTEDLSILGTTVFAGVCLAVLLQIALDTYNYSLLFVGSVLASVLSFVIYVIIVSHTEYPTPELIGIGTEMTNSGLVMILMFFPPLACFCVSFAANSYRSIFSPGLLERIRLNGNAIGLRFRRLEQFANGLAAAYRATNAKQDIEDESFDLKKYSLHFKSNYIERDYREKYINENIRFYQYSIAFFWLLLVAWTLIEALAFEADLLFTLLRVLLSVGFTVIMLLVFTKPYKEHYVSFNLLIIFIGIVVKFAMEIGFTRAGLLSQALIPSITYILFNVDFIKVTIANVLSLALMLTGVIYFASETIDSTEEGVLFILSTMVLSIAIVATSAYVGYVLERTSRQEYKMIEQKENSLLKTQSILAFLLPSFVRKNVKEGARYIAKDQGTVTVIFCDICGFDAICAEYTPLELTTFLDDIFQTFDQLCNDVGVTKVETVGKTYMACAGLKDFEDEIPATLREIGHARRAVEFATCLLAHIKHVKLKNGQNMQVKIGINSGPVTAGVVGHHKPQFSLVGDTVNTASRMCSTIESSNCIQISEDTYNILEDRKGLSFISSCVEAKGKGLMRTYLVGENDFELDDIIADSQLQAPAEQSSNIRENSMLEDPEKRDISRNVKGSAIMSISNPEAPEQTQLIAPVKIFDLSLRETAAQRAYRIDKMTHGKVTIELTLITAVVTLSALLVLSIAEYFVLDDFSNEFVLILRALSILLFVGTHVFLKRLYLSRVYYWLLLGILNVPLYAVLMYIISDSERNNDLMVLEVMYLILLFNYGSDASITLQIFASLLVSIPWVVVVFINDAEAIHVANSMFVLGFAIMNISAVYTRENKLRNSMNLQKLAEIEIEKTHKLLTQMMPPHVLENMKAGKGTTDKFQGVTLLYADIVGFTSWSSNKTPNQVVQMLSNMFTDFDKMCLTHNVYKVHTIGDCYVVLGFINDQDRHSGRECMNVLRMAYSMIDIIKKVNEKYGSNLNMRIGIHTGEVIAGITGTNIVRYDIYGPDVLIANKMESEGEQGKINVSDVTRQIIEQNSDVPYNFVFNKEIHAKSISRTHKSFFIEAKPNEFIS